jgi:hypothetical protein
VTDSLETLGFEDTDSLAALIEDETMNHASREMDVTDIIHDLAVAQRELEQYRQGALSLAASLDDKVLEAEAAGNVERADALRRLKRSAMDVYGRVEG